MKYKNHILFGLIALILISSSMFSNAAVAQETSDTIDKEKESLSRYHTLDTIDIGILYDPNVVLTNSTAQSLYYSLSLMTPNVQLFSVEYPSQLETILRYDLEIAFYVFESDHKEMKLHDRGRSYAITWTDLASTLSKYTGTHHVFSMGNSRQILQEMNYSPNIHGAGDEKVDAQHAFVYGLWTLADVLEAHYPEEGGLLARDVRMASLEYFANNMNQLIAKNMKPDSPLGAEDPLTKQERIDRFYENHPSQIQRIPQDGNIIDEETGKEIDPLTGEEQQYALDFVDPNELTPTDLILNFLPDASGVRGPIGGIVDELLGFLIDKIGSTIGLSTETVTELANTLLSIPDFIGAVKDPTSSKLKEFLDNLKHLVPLPEDKLEYFDLLTDALFLLRGNPSDIINFINEAIAMIVPDLGIDLAGSLSAIYDLGSTAVNDLASGDKFMDVIFSVLNEQIVTDMLDKFLNASILGVTTSQFTTVIDQTMGTIKAIINTIATGDFLSLVQEYLPNVLGEFSGIMGNLPGYGAEAIGLLTSIIMVATGAVDGETVADLLEQLLDYILPDLDVDGIREAVEGIMEKLGKLIDNPGSITDIRQSIQSILSDLGVDTTAYSDAIKSVEDIILMILSIKSDGFDLVDTGIDVASSLVALLTEFGLSNDQQNTVNEIVNIILAAVSFISNPPNLDDLLGDFLSSLPDLETVIHEIIVFFAESIGSAEPIQPGTAVSLNSLTSEGEIQVGKISEAIALILDVIKSSGDNAIEGLLYALLQGGAYMVTEFTGVDVSAYIETAKAIFGKILGYFDSPPSLADVLADISSFVPSDYQDEVEKIVGFILDIQDIFTGGFQTVFAKLGEWLAGQVTQLIESVTGEFTDILNQEEWSLFSIDLPIGIGDFSLFDMKIELGLKPGFGFNEDTFYQMIFDLVFKGVSIFSDDVDAGDVVKQALKFLNIHPIFTASLELDGFGSGSSGFVDFMLTALGVELSFSGSGFFELSLLSFKNGVFNTDDFFKILGWGFSFTLTLSRTFTLLDFLTGGAAGSLNSIGQYIGLDAISITIAFTIMLEIIKRAATANAPETGSLTISMTIAFTVSLGIDIVIAKLKLTGTLEITLTLLQDLVEPTPLRVFISILLIITVTIGFLFWDWDFEYRWSPDDFKPEDPYEITPNDQESAAKDGALGADFDNDGISNDMENQTAGLDPFSADSDGDTLSDKFETQTLNTDPSSKDTDGDGLNDNIELDMRTDPLNPDSDFDRIDDYTESAILGTNPLAFDTDEDGLDDYYEVNHSYNMTGITPNVKEIVIGGQTYNDRTDPLNPDTDGDGLLDGEEGERGIYYGPHLYNETEQPEFTPDPPLFFNGGYTHPLDNDTDDDSYEQDYSGAITPRRKFLRDMSDYTEIHGIEVIYIDPVTGEPETPVIVRTNPTNPDSDGDTGVTEQQRENPPFGFFLNSDGYELALDPPTDPLDGDTDDDGLIDGYEGILRPDANHTDVNNPDTDGDGLGDLQEITLGSDPRSVDTDLDGVSDADEFFIYGTSPFLADHDSDGLTDGEELFLYHSSPFMRDTDMDGIPDYDEVWKYFSDPADEDSDNDGLDDFEEIFIHYTDPFEADTDQDGLFDGDEVLGLNYTVADENGTLHSVLVYTDPLKWDTDGDSLLTEDQNGEISQPMSDYDEWKLKTRPDRMDTDFDGIQDGWELWLGKGLIPDFDPVDLDPLNDDTDGDTLKDGAELVIANQSTLLYPYIGFYVLTPYNTSAVSNDTDGDAIPDNIEIQIGSHPDLADSDNDTLSDNAEYYIYETSLIKNDTDGDGLLDNEEIQGYNFTQDGETEVIFTDPLNDDSDGDLLPDGAEVKTYMSDPRDDDEDLDDILDGMQIDSDRDGLYDGEEYYVYFTTLAAEGGGPFSPDSDRDGLFDGREVYETNTNASYWDTDHDTFSDGLEVACGTDPNNNLTTVADLQVCFDELDRLMVLSPATNKVYETNTFPVLAYDPDNEVTKMEFSYKYGENLTMTSLTHDMERDQNKPLGYWKSKDTFSFPFKTGLYELEIRAMRQGDTITRVIPFYINNTAGEFEILSPVDGRTYVSNIINQTQPISLPIEVRAGINYTSVWFSMIDGSGTYLTTNQTLTVEEGLGNYYLPEYELPRVQGTANYTIVVYANQSNGQVVRISSTFYTKIPTTGQTAIAAGGVVGGAAVVTTVIRRAGFKSPFSKEEDI